MTNLELIDRLIEELKQYKEANQPALSDTYQLQRGLRTVTRNIDDTLPFLMAGHP